MKRLTITLVVTVLMAFFASSAFSEGMYIGVKGGINLAKAWGDDVADDIKMRMAPNFGAFFCYQVHEFFAVQPEVYYAMKGWKFEEGDDKETDKLNYIDIILLGRLTIPMEGMIHPFFFAGPYIGMNISADYETEIGGVSDEGEIEYVKSTDYGAVVGGGADIEIEGVGRIVIDARYSLGLSTLFDVEGDPDEKNNAITFMVGYAYGF